MAEIEVHGLFGEEVDRDGVAGESVHGEDVEVLRVAVLQFLLEGKAGVAHGDIQFGFAVGQVEELFPGQFQYQRIDLVVSYIIAQAAVGGSGSGTKSDDADANRAG